MPWSFAALSQWPGEHHTVMIVLISLQAAAWLGAAGVVFWITRKRGV
jgi:hypothetical protein